MFGFLALGFFTAMALKNNGNGGNGGGLFAGILASLVAIKGIKETLAELGWGKKKKEEEENTSSSSDGIGGGDYEEDFGITGLDDGKDKNTDPTVLGKNRSLAMMQRAVENAPEEEKEKTQEAYDAYIKCMYNEDGTEKSEDEMNAALEDLKTNRKDLYDSITNNVKTLAEDSEALDEYTKEIQKINPNQAAAATEQAQADRIKIRNKEQTEAIDREIEELNNSTSDEDKEKDEYKNKLKDLQDRKKAVETQADSEIKEHEKKAKDLKNKPYEGVKTARENDEIKSGLDELKANREERKKLGGDNAVSYMTSEYDKYNSGIEGFSISDITSGTLSHDDDERLTAICKEKGIDRGSLEAYYAYKQADPKDKDKKKKAFEDKLRKQISKRCDELDKEYDQKRLKLQEKVNNHNESINKNKQQGTTDTTGSTGPTGTTDPNEVIKTVKKFEKQENDKEWYPEIDEDGDPTGNFAVCVVKEKDEDGNEVLKYVMRDNSGEEVEISKEDFETHKTNFNEFKEELNPEDEEKLDNALDETYTETEEEKNSDEGKEAERDETNGKRVNPAKIWHKKKNKNTGKSTKNYYNKKGDSISSDEYHKRIENYKAYVQKHKNQVQDKNSLTDYLRDKMVVEHFTPKNDISEYLKSCF